MTGKEKKITQVELESPTIVDFVFEDIEKNGVTYIVYDDNDKPIVAIVPYDVYEEMEGKKNG